MTTTDRILIYFEDITFNDIEKLQYYTRRVIEPFDVLIQQIPDTIRNDKGLRILIRNKIYYDIISITINEPLEVVRNVNKDYYVKYGHNVGEGGYVSDKKLVSDSIRLKDKVKILDEWNKNRKDKKAPYYTDHKIQKYMKAQIEEKKTIDKEAYEKKLQELIKAGKKQYMKKFYKEYNKNKK